jgi:hypothetical protein
VKRQCLTVVCITLSIFLYYLLKRSEEVSQGTATSIRASTSAASLEKENLRHASDEPRQDVPPPVIRDGSGQSRAKHLT